MADSSPLFTCGRASWAKEVRQAKVHMHGIAYNCCATAILFTETIANNDVPICPILFTYSLTPAGNITTPWSSWVARRPPGSGKLVSSGACMWSCVTNPSTSTLRFFISASSSAPWACLPSFNHATPEAALANNFLIGDCSAHRSTSITGPGELEVVWAGRTGELLASDEKARLVVNLIHSPSCFSRPSQSVQWPHQLQRRYAPPAHNPMANTKELPLALVASAVERERGPLPWGAALHVFEQVFQVILVQDAVAVGIVARHLGSQLVTEKVSWFWGLETWSRGKGWKFKGFFWFVASSVAGSSTISRSVSNSHKRPQPRSWNVCVEE